jgi:hypothetical protein
MPPHPPAHRIQVHLPAQPQPMGLTVHPDRLETPLEHRPCLAVAAVEALR